VDATNTAIQAIRTEQASQAEPPFVAPAAPAAHEAVLQPPAMPQAAELPAAPVQRTLPPAQSAPRRPAPVATSGTPGTPAANADGSISAARIAFNPRDELITTLIAAPLRVKGTLQGPEGVMVKGTLDGDILIDDSGEANTGTVIVFEGATVNGMISGRRVIVFGTVNGPIISRTILTIADTGVVNGDVYYNRLLNSEGGAIEGNMRRIIEGVDPLADVQARLERP